MKMRWKKVSLGTQLHRIESFNMILKQLKPTTPGQRQRVYVDKKTLDDPYNKRLFKPLERKEDVTTMFV